MHSSTLRTVYCEHCREPYFYLRRPNCIDYSNNPFKPDVGKAPRRPRGHARWSCPSCGALPLAVYRSSAHPAAFWILLAILFCLAAGVNFAWPVPNAPYDPRKLVPLHMALSAALVYFSLRPILRGAPMDQSEEALFDSRFDAIPAALYREFAAGLNDEAVRYWESEIELARQESEAGRRALERQAHPLNAKNAKRLRTWGMAGLAVAVVWFTAGLLGVISWQSKIDENNHYNSVMRGKVFQPHDAALFLQRYPDSIRCAEVRDRLDEHRFEHAQNTYKQTGNYEAMQKYIAGSPNAERKARMKELFAAASRENLQRIRARAENGNMLFGFARDMLPDGVPMPQSIFIDLRFAHTNAPLPAVPAEASAKKIAVQSPAPPPPAPPSALPQLQAPPAQYVSIRESEWSLGQSTDALRRKLASKIQAALKEKAPDTGLRVQLLWVQQNDEHLRLTVRQQQRDQLLRQPYGTGNTFYEFKIRTLEWVLQRVGHSRAGGTGDAVYLAHGEVSVAPDFVYPAAKLPRPIDMLHALVMDLQIEALAKQLAELQSTPPVEQAPKP